jgi:hypothetical protein
MEDKQDKPLVIGVILESVYPVSLFFLSGREDIEGVSTTGPILDFPDPKKNPSVY